MLGEKRSDMNGKKLVKPEKDSKAQPILALLGVDVLNNKRGVEMEWKRLAIISSLASFDFWRHDLRNFAFVSLASSALLCAGVINNNNTAFTTQTFVRTAPCAC